MRHGHLHRAGLQHLGSQRGHLQHLFVADLGQPPGLGLDPRVGGVDPVDVGVDVADVGLHRRGDGDGAGVRAAAAQGGNAALPVDALETGDHGDLAAVHGGDQLLRRNLLDPGAAVGAVGEDRHLPAHPRAGAQAHVAQRHGEKAGGHLLAGGHYRVVLVVRGLEPLRGRAGAVSPGHQLVCLAGHGRYHDSHPLARLDLSGHQPGDAPDALQVGHRGAAEFHHQA